MPPRPRLVVTARIGRCVSWWSAWPASTAARSTAGRSPLADSWQLPAEWLDALPFDGWSIPGALLLGLIGIPGLVGATVETLGRRWVVPWSLAYGVGLVAWIGVQVLLVPPFFLQPVIAAAGTVIAAASWARLRLTHH